MRAVSHDGHHQAEGYAGPPKFYPPPEGDKLGALAMAVVSNDARAVNVLLCEDTWALDSLPLAPCGTQMLYLAMVLGNADVVRGLATGGAMAEHYGYERPAPKKMKR